MFLGSCVIFIRRFLIFIHHERTSIADRCDYSFDRANVETAWYRDRDHILNTQIDRTLRIRPELYDCVGIRITISDGSCYKLCIVNDIRCARARVDSSYPNSENPRNRDRSVRLSSGRLQTKTTFDFMSLFSYSFMNVLLL